MLDKMKAASDGCGADAGLMVDRVAQQARRGGLPAGLKIVSADNHIEVTEDIFYEAFPARLRDAAPRVWLDGYWRIGYRGSMQTYPEGVDVDGALTKAVLTEGFDFTIRQRHLGIEGIDKEIVYPQSLLAFIRHPDQEVQELIYRIYNEYIATLGKRHPGQFYGVGICSNWWEPAKAEAAIRQDRERLDTPVAVVRNEQRLARAIDGPVARTLAFRRDFVQQRELARFRVH